MKYKLCEICNNEIVNKVFIDKVYNINYGYICNKCKDNIKKDRE